MRSCRISIPAALVRHPLGLTANPHLNDHLSEPYMNLIRKAYYENRKKKIFPPILPEFAM